MQTKPAHRLDFVRSTPFFLVHALAVAGVFWLGWSWSGLALAVGLYVVRMFGVTGAYHRYFSHRTYKTSRPFQLLLALLAMTSVQKGVLWWAAHHRHHHRTSDQPGDTHSVLQDGFWFSHVGWILSPDNHDTDLAKVKDLAKYSELVWLDRYYYVPAIAYAVGLYALGGVWALYWGFAVSTTLLWHGTFTINSLSHVFGSKRYVTTDESRNNLWLALITLGEGWHNNHHYYQRATNQGFFWWEIDVTFYVLKALSWVGLVWDLHTPPPHVRDTNRLADASQPTLDVLTSVPVPALAPSPLAAVVLPSAPR
jgi:stearoyl-CoA desaturase (Delta-9 desaturase)